jgi:hypothetical protein
MEQISGPYNGFYIATYASDVGTSPVGYIAYSKICRGRPDNYWDAHCCAKVSGEQTHSTPEAALAEAEGRAREQTGNLVAFAFAPPRGLPLH